MSTLLKSTANGPLMHMTSDAKTVEELEGDPIATTVFHSDLPYVLTSEQFEITTYTDNLFGTGARSFHLPADCTAFRTNNPRRLYFTILYTADGGALFHYPMGTMRYELGITDWIAASASGCEYQVFYDDSTYSEFRSAGRIGLRDPDNSTTLAYRFDRWEPTSTELVVLRSEALLNTNISFNFLAAEQDQFNANYRMISTDLDIVRVRIVFLNTEVTADGLDFIQKADFSELNEIRISPNSFDIGNYDLANNTPLRIIKTTQNNEEISDVYGEAVALKRPDIFDLTQEPVYQKVLVGTDEKEDFTFANSGMVCVDVPKFFSSTAGVLRADLVNQTVSRARVLPTDYTQPFIFDDSRFAQVFASTTAGSGMRVVGKRSLSFDLNIEVSSGQEQTLSLTDWTDSFSEDVYYMATLDMHGDFTGCQILTEGENLIQKIVVQDRNARENGVNSGFRLNFDLRIFIEVDSDSRARARARVKAGTWNYFFPLPIIFLDTTNIALLAIAR